MLLSEATATSIGEIRKTFEDAFFRFFICINIHIGEVYVII